MVPTTLVRKVLLRIAADDGDTEAKLDKIHAKAGELARLHPELKVKVDTAEAAAKLAVLRKELRDTGNQSETAKISMRGLGTVLAGLVTGGLSGGISEMSLFQKGMLGLNVATGLGEPLVAGLTVAVGGLSAGLVSAGAGLGAFGLVAKGVYSQVSSAVQAYQTSISTTGKASAKAMGQYQAYMAALTPAQRGVARAIDAADASWQNFVAHNTSGVASVMSQGFGLLPKVFASLQPFLGPTETALHGLIGDLSKGLSSSGFKDWISSFAAASGPMLSNLGHAIGHIVVGLGGILKAFLPVAGQMTHGLDDITAKFAHWGTTLSQHSGFKDLMSMFKTETPLAVGVIKNLGSTIKNLVGDMAGLSTFSNSRMLLQIAEPITGLLSALVKGNPALVAFGLYALAAFSGLKKISSGVTSISAGFTAIKGAGSMIQGLAIKMGILQAATEEETTAQEANDAAMDANPIGLIVLALAALAIGFYELIKHCKAFRDFWKELWHDVKAWTMDAVRYVIGSWNDLWAEARQLVSDLRGAWDRASADVHHWASDVARDAMAVVHWFEQLPGRIAGALAALPGMLWRAGVNAIRSLIGGLLSMAGSLGSAVSSLASKVAGFFGLSPAKEGPLSGSGAMRFRGQHAIADFAAGMGDRMPQLAAQSGRIAAAAGMAGRGPALAGAGGYRPVTVVLEFQGADQALTTALKKIIRVRGGDPAVIGR